MTSLKSDWQSSVVCVVCAIIAHTNSTKQSANYVLPVELLFPTYTTLVQGLILLAGDILPAGSYIPRFGPENSSYIQVVFPTDTVLTEDIIIPPYSTFNQPLVLAVGFKFKYSYTLPSYVPFPRKTSPPPTVTDTTPPSTTSSSLVTSSSAISSQNSSTEPEIPSVIVRRITTPGEAAELDNSQAECKEPSEATTST
ncbi:hypothetical protein EB796_010449 [Bugula neritina]|uniref:Uncharacterized protein n=1 Tax=Bugula neritina TaxID=10212 RepID=A0A7J7JZ52_BUGNE|nr:hypothetical protein EB796_010449 [Bugula neritina]